MRLLDEQPLCACRLQCAQAVARSYQGLQSQAEGLGQLQVIHAFATSFDADAYMQTPRSVKQLRQDIMLLRQGHNAFFRKMSVAQGPDHVSVSVPSRYEFEVIKAKLVPGC